MDNCFRCNGSLIDITPSDVEEGSFYRCTRCHSEYIKRLEKPLCDRWGMPLTVALYGLICADNTDDKIDEIVDQMQRQGRGFIGTLIVHITLEMKHPKQNVSDMLNFQYLDEIALRCFLVKLKEKLQRLSKENHLE